MSESRAWIDREPPKPDPVGVAVTDEMAEVAEDAEQACASSHGGTRWPCCRRAGLAAVVPLIAERVRAQLTALAPCGNGCVLAAVALSEQVWTGEEKTGG